MCIRDSAWDVPYLAYVPEMAARDALAKVGMTIEEMDVVETVSYTHLTLPTSDLV